MPNNAGLLDVLGCSTDSVAIPHKILAENPRGLYDFD